MRTVPSLLISVAAAAGLFAQLVPARPDEMTWDGPRVVLSQAQRRTLQIHQPGDGPLQELQAPEGSWDLHFYEGSAYCLGKEPYGTKPNARVLFMSTNLKTWTRYGNFQDQDAHLLHCYPLDDHRFFMISTPFRPFRLGREVSPFAVGRLNEGGNLEVKELTNLGFKQAILQKLPTKSEDGRERFALAPKLEYLYSLLFSNAPFVRLNSGFALVADQVGMFWLFDGKGRMRKRAMLFPSLTEEQLADRNSLEQALLGYQPRDDGQVLIASRSLSAVLNARKRYPRDERLESMGDAEVQKENAKQTQKSLEAYPELKWWLLDPEDGAITEAEPPLKVKDHFDEVAEVTKFKFRFTPSGNLRFGDEEPGPGSPAPAETKAK